MTEVNLIHQKLISMVEIHEFQFEFGIGGDDKMNSSSWILKGYFERQRKLLGI